MLSTQGEYKREKEREREMKIDVAAVRPGIWNMNKFWRVKYEISPQSIKYEIWEKSNGWNNEIWKKKCQKKNEKYEKKQKSKKIYNMKYEKKKAFCDFVNMKYEKFNGQKT